MTAKTFAVLTSLGFISMLIGCDIYNRSMTLFGLALLLLPAAAVIVQSEVK